VVWREVINLLENPSLIQQELDRRLTAARDAHPTKQREESLRRELGRVQKSMDRLMTAYQEDLLSLEDLRRRMPELRKREQSTQTELSSLLNQLADRAGYLRLVETLSGFLERLGEAAKTLDVLQRQRIVRLLVKEVLVADDAIVIRHSIPVTNDVPRSGGPPSASTGRPPATGGSYLLRKGGSQSRLS
jgi:site-specific DNA recombinase